MQALIESIGALGSKQRKALAVLLKQQGVNLYEVAPVFKRPEGEPLQLSYAQERQWFLWKLDPLSPAYHIPMSLRLRGPLDMAALQRSLHDLVVRHEGLRTTFAQVDDQLLQCVAPHMPVDVQVLRLEAGADDDALRRRIEPIIAMPFDLEQGPLFRVALLALGPQDHALVIVQHHIISDGVSMRVMVQELVQLYAGYSQGHEPALTPLPIQYADYALWQRQWLEAGEKDRQLDYWQQRLAGEQPVLTLPFDHARSGTPTHQGARITLELEGAQYQRLQALARQEGVTLFVVLLASFQALLYRYTGQSDVRIGVPVANRNRMETERLIGFFVNTLVLRADLDGHMVSLDLLHQARQRSLEAQAHQDLPFEQLVEALRPQRSMSQTPLFQVMFNHLNAREAHEPRMCLAGLEIEALEWSGSTAQFDLTLNTHETEQALSACFNFATDLFDSSTIARMARHWRNLLCSFVENPQRRLCELALLDEDERLDLLARGDQTTAGFPSHVPVHQMIAAQAAKNPDARALTFADAHMTYAQLDQAANGLAHRLIELGVGPEVRVAVAMQRCADSLVAFLAVLKAGGAYVPLDVQYPADRLAYMLRDSQASLVLTRSEVVDALSIPALLPVLVLDENAAWRAFEGAAPCVPVSEDNLAYVIYTSGSTGMPKGVAVAHGPLAMHCLAIGECYEMTPADCELHFMSFAFDGAHEGWMHPLMHGARLLIRDDELWTPAQTYALMQRHGVTVAVFPPLYLQQLAEHAQAHGNPPAVRVYCFGGDAMPRAAYELAWQALRPRYLLNGYGPTETVVTPLIWKARPGDACDAAYAPIGNLIARRRGQILDSDLNLLPAGLPGELYLGGCGLARGYLERPGLTAERFVPDPFDAAGGRLYRSGDLTRQRHDGAIDYLGRLDHQVKVRGFRIELGEIEACISELESVREAVVLVRQGPAGKQLVGYVALATRDSIESHEAQSACRVQILEALKTRLPDYMVPAHLMFVARMPVTPNGKLDRAALLAMRGEHPEHDYVAPRDLIEQQLADLWLDVLGGERIGVHDHFFERGGDSLLALKLLSKVARETTFGHSLKLRDLMGKPTIDELAQFIRHGTGQCNPVLLLNRPVSDAAPVFAFHMLYGTVVDYRALAMRLDSQRPVYGLQCRMLLDTHWTDHSLQTMAKDYATLIRRHQPLGPYTLMGWSLGGTLAVLVAHELERQGQRVAFLGLVDAFIPQADSARGVSIEDVMQELRGFLTHLFGSLPEALEYECVVNAEVDIQAIEQLVAQLKAHRPPQASSYAALAADELARMFQVGMHLKALCDQMTTLPALLCDTGCWWAANPGAASLRNDFEASCGHLRLSCTLEVSHQAIIHDVRVLDSVVDTLTRPAWD